jgi:hypothetical protein
LKACDAVHSGTENSAPRSPEFVPVMPMLLQENRNAINLRSSMSSDQNHQSTDPPTAIPEADLGLNLAELGSLFIAMSNYAS